MNSAGVPGKMDSFAPSISASGRIVAFQSQSPNLSCGHDRNHTINIFVHNLKTGKTKCVSVSSAGAQANEERHAPSISAHGRFVAFESFATNLTPHDTNHQLDVFVHDRKTGKTRRISVSPTGRSGNGESSHPSISEGGRFVAFESWARNLVRRDRTHAEDVFVRDRRNDRTRLVSVNSDGAQGHGVSREPSISADGRFVRSHRARAIWIPATRTRGTTSTSATEGPARRGSRA